MFNRLTLLAFRAPSHHLKFLRQNPKFRFKKLVPPFKLFYHLNSHRIYLLFFLLAFAGQIFFWKKTESLKPHFDLVPAAPSKYLTSALAFGDDEFLFRIFATRLQNSGDVFAGFVALKNYDYLRIYQWLKVLDSLDSKSNFAPALASYYYSQTQKTEDSRYIVNYLDEHAAKNLDEKWWWLLQAIFIAKSQLKDLDLALDLAYKLSKNNAKNAPFWTKQMPAFISKEMGNNCLAFSIIEKLLQESEKGVHQISVKEMNFMRHFISEQLARLHAQKFDPRKCSKNPQN